MDRMLFSTLLRNLLHVDVIPDGQEDGVLDGFEKRYCYNPALQPMFCAETLTRFTEDMEETVLYEFRDSLGICLLSCLLEQRPVLIGPFVRREFHAERARRAMLSLGMPAAYAESIRIYYSNFPLCGMSRAIDTVSACIRALSDGTEFGLCRIDDYPLTQKLPRQIYQESLDYSSLYRRYEQENQFLLAVEKGDTENVLSAYDRMSALNISSNRYVNAIYQDAGIGLSITRTLARKAAENGGASVIEIHEITQRAVQQGLSATNVNEKVKITRNMLLELTEAVNRARSQAQHYSDPIQKAVDTLRHNFSQEITLPWLASHVGLSSSHLSRTFTKEVGIPVSQYTATLRCEEAASLLKRSDIPIHEIAAYVGYTDNNYFV